MLLLGNRMLNFFIPFHDVAPVAGGIPDRQENRFVFAPGLRKGLLAPRIPVDRIVRVLQQVGTGFVDKIVALPVIRHQLHNLQWLRRLQCNGSGGTGSATLRQLDPDPAVLW